MFKKILIANRGEVALRIIYACKELGIKTVAVYSEADENSLHVKFADEDGAIESEDKAIKMAKDIGYRVIIKATAGGGGRGMRVVRNVGELPHAFKTAQREAEAAFGVGDVYIEKYVESPRHIEFQILGDHHGSVAHLGERECSIQRRHQKLIEESPSPGLSEKMRRKMGSIVIDAAKAVQYTNAGTFEFLMDPDGRFYFMEANTRLQVEHPVTDMVTGVDI